MSTSLVRRLAPKFNATAVVGSDFKPISLDSMTADGHYAVLVFIPAAFTFVCPTEVIAISEAADKFKALKVNVAFCSVDTTHAHLAWTQLPRNKGGLGKVNFPIISDVTHKIGRDYNVLVVDEEDDMVGLELRGTYIIDSKQRVRAVEINDAPVGRDVDALLTKIEALQFSDANDGMVCPAGWKKGSRAMAADPVKSKEYFEAVNN